MDSLQKAGNLPNMTTTNDLRDTQENKVPIADFPSGALLRECTLQRSTHPVLYLEARPLAVAIQPTADLKSKLWRVERFLALYRADLPVVVLLGAIVATT
jgi:hypothetical protein